MNRILQSRLFLASTTMGCMILLVISIPRFLNLQSSGEPAGERDDPIKPFLFDRYSGVTVKNFEHAEALMMLRHRNAPMVGETAPDSKLIDAGSGRNLSIHRVIKNKPLVLIFGSSSCTSLETHIPDIRQLCERYHERIDFAFVYIREAHPRGGFMPRLKNNGVEYTKPPLPDATRIDERREEALKFQKKISNRLATYVDSLNDELAVRWGAWPLRVFVIGPDRRLIYSGGPGPYYCRFGRESWHSAPSPWMENEFLRMPFSRESLEEFLESFSFQITDNQKNS